MSAHLIPQLFCLAMIVISSHSWAQVETSLPQKPDFSSCHDHQVTTHAQATLLERREAMAGEIERFQTLAEEALSLRAAALRFHQALQIKSQNKEPLSGADLQLLREGASTLLAQRKALLDIATQHECWALVAPHTNPEEAAVTVAGVAMSLSAALILYDNYLLAIAPFRQNASLRQLLNRSDNGFELQTGALDEITRSFSDLENRQRVRRAFDWLQLYRHTANAAPIRGDRYLYAMIEQSPAIAIVRKTQAMKDITGGLGSLTTLAFDSLFALKDEGSNLTSLLFGNTVGLVETRRGKLYRQSAILEHVEMRLKAGDVLLEKTPFRLTDTFIPGHWGHAAIWVGTETELKALKIWDHPVLRPHQAAIRQGHSVVEALRSGVEINTLANFMNIDDLGVLRHPSLSDEKRAEVILLTLRQIGKPYDFNFDAETTQRIFCSKLVYLTYGDLQWPTSRIMGRVTVSPDNIAARALGDGPFDVAVLYHDGQEIIENQRGFMQTLLTPIKRGQL